ncbi:hypothetical protein TSAR_006354 [Trichomalopsis sarcophagae]|uniref:Uncharacterized protein n=1 Tax=Trichomalopsis sarcophagae TaxID=543379 RepID=A0A232FLD3_9HYME|nr:hypothetical protein TSAR_006354 [Trichomalopsis sarcophagae]
MADRRVLPYGAIRDLTKGDHGMEVLAEQGDKEKPPISGSPTPKPVQQGNTFSGLKRIITEVNEYAKGKTNVYGPIKTGLSNALIELGKIEKKGMALLKVPELRLRVRRTGTNSSTQQMIEYRQYRQKAIKARKEEEEHNEAGKGSRRPNRGLSVHTKEHRRHLKTDSKTQSFGDPVEGVARRR